MHRHAIFGGFMHSMSTNLYLYQLVIKAEDGGVQCAVAVGFRIGDVVFDAALFWTPQAMDVAQRDITIRGGSDQDTKSDQVVNLTNVGNGFELLQVFYAVGTTLKFLVEAVEVFYTP